jgi:hypothetical protein
MWKLDFIHSNSHREIRSGHVVEKYGQDHFSSGPHSEKVDIW